MNSTLFNYVVPQNVVSWLRVMVANQITGDGKNNKFYFKIKIKIKINK